MRYLSSLSMFACLAILGDIAPVIASTSDHNPANTISLSVDHPDSFRHFTPELDKFRERTPRPNTESGLHIREIEPGLFFVTDMIYQSAFMVTQTGIVVFDAPPSFGDRLRPLIEATAPGQPITHYIMSHGHGDHSRGGYVFEDIENLEVIAAAEVAATLKATPLRGVLTPTRTFDTSLNLTIGGVPIELQTAHYHSEDADVLIYLPDQKFLMAVDSITPGEAPFMNFGATMNVQAYFEIFDTFLAYDFKHFFSGHVSVLGTREDVEIARDYVWDVRDTVFGLMPSFMERMMEAMEVVDFQHSNLAYRVAMESIRDECAREIITDWKDTLSVVDLWADSHCETTLLYAITH